MKGIVLTPKEPTTSTADLEHKENIIENGQQQQLQQSQEPEKQSAAAQDESVKSKNLHKKNNKNRRIELEG